MDELQFAASQGECEALCDQVKHSIKLYAINIHFQIRSTVCLLILLHVVGYFLIIKPKRCTDFLNLYLE